MPRGPYRFSDGRDRPANQTAALVELGRRRARARARVLAVALVVGFASGLWVTAALATSTWFFGRAWPQLVVCFGLLPVVVLSAVVGLRLGRWAARARTPGWVRALADLHHVSREALAEDAQLLDGIEAEAELEPTD